MVMDIPLSRPGQPKAATEIPWTRIDLDLYEVACDGLIVGYVEVVGAIFVALRGAARDLPRCGRHRPPRRGSVIPRG